MNGFDPSLGQRIRVMQIVAGSLIAGSLTFLVIVFFMVHNNQGHGTAPVEEGALPIISLMALGVLLVQVPLAFFLPTTMLRQGIDQLASQPPSGEHGPGGPVNDNGSLLAIKQSTMIVSMALFEGASFFASIAYLMEGQPFALAVSTAAIVGLVAFFPTEGRLTSWLEQQRFVLNDLRSRKRTSPKT